MGVNYMCSLRRTGGTNHADIVAVQQDLGQLGVVSRIVTSISCQQTLDATWMDGIFPRTILLHPPAPCLIVVSALCR